MSKKGLKKTSISIITVLILLVGGYNYQDIYNIIDNNLASVLEKREEVKYSYDITKIPPYSGSSSL